jgi:hypothetical protein
MTSKEFSYRAVFYSGIVIALVLIYLIIVRPNPQKTGVMYLDGIKWVRTDTSEVLVTRESVRELELAIITRLKQDSIKDELYNLIRMQDFEYGYRLAYYNMLKGRFGSYSEFNKQWEIDSIKMINNINENNR